MSSQLEQYINLVISTYTITSLLTKDSQSYMKIIKLLNTYNNIEEIEKMQPEGIILSPGEIYDNNLLLKKLKQIKEQKNKKSK
jgi:hypothetical protein